MLNLLGVFLGGGTGAVLRHLVCLRFGSPWAVFFVNVSGALFIGFAFAFFAAKTGWRPETKAFIMTGLLGGFTTFSTYMLDFGAFISNRQWSEGLFYLFGSLAAGIAFLAVGIKIGRLVF